ncbi:kinase-like domain-containing protein [Phaeosphaeriaceae sp. PMI808]|nr:kinase-like domain-containing protein [Phaeosphaeriaceae sp. PMI808]
MAEQAEAGGPPAGQDARIEYFVRLSGFEQQLISELDFLLNQEHFAAFDPDHFPIAIVFSEWKWSHLVKNCLNDDLGHDGEYLYKDYAGDRTKAYDSFIHFLAHTGGEERNLARAEGFRRANETFLLNLGNRSICDVNVKPPEEDLPLWETISRLYQACGKYWKYEESLNGTNGKFVIFTLIRKFTLQWKWPENVDIVERVLVQNPAFKASYNVERELIDSDPLVNLSSDQALGRKLEELHITKLPPAGSTQRWPEGEPKKDESGEVTDAYLRFLLRRLGRSAPIEDPRSYVQFIPWAHLKRTDAEVLQRSGMRIEVPFSENMHIHAWVLWRPPNPGFAWNHHVYTEDEVYEYNVLNNWSFPDHYFEDQVVFGVREVDRTDFISELGNYWEAWNDCALTKENSGGPLLLLETIPGMRFRGRIKGQDKVAALTYFRNIVEAHANGSLEDSTIRDIVGLDASKNLQFEHSLRVIPEHQLLDIHWDKPIGQGKNGAVYAGIWHKPVGHLATTRAGERDMKIVLKDVLPRSGTSEEPLKKLLKELDLTYASLGGSAVGCVNFVGVARLRQRPTILGETGEQTILTSQTPYLKSYLVFERATQGTAIDFLSRQFINTSYFKSWDLALSALSSVGNGIASLHAHGVIHRDLHMNNILVTDRFYPNDPTYPHEYSYLIGDIGEGKILSTTHEVKSAMDHWASYGAIEFRAPEIFGPRGWSTKAEVFSFGIIASKILECRRFVCPASPPEWALSELEHCYPGIRQDQDMMAHVVPDSLKKAIEPCLSYSPNDRPTMKNVVHALDDMSSEFWTEDFSVSEDNRKVKWTYWAWDESKKYGRISRPSHSESEDTSRITGSDEFAGYSSVPDLDSS